MNKLKKYMAVVFAITMFAGVSCGDTGDSGKENSTGEQSAKGYADIQIGTDYTDLSADLTVMTCRTDIVAENPDIMDYTDYVREFNEMYPNIKVVFEGITEYDVDMTTRLNSGTWDICFIPSTLTMAEYPTYFEPVCQYSDLPNYNFVTHDEDGSVYGIPSSANAQGVVYNKKVFEEAGITEIPKTPDDFIDALKAIKENTDAIPLYTNYAARWTMGAWDVYAFCGATGDTEYMNFEMPYDPAPFTQNEERTGPYEVYNILYRAVDEGLVEDDPTTTNWELCKADINNGKIGCMMLGSWAIPQMQGAGENSDDIGYMPFPISVDGVQYATTVGDYAYGINIKGTDDEKLASKIFIKFMVENSSYSKDQGGISVVKGGELPDVLLDFKDAQLIMDSPVPEGDTNAYAIVNEGSGLMLQSDSEHVIRIVDAAMSGDETFDDIMADWNEKWAAAQEGITPDSDAGAEEKEDNTTE